MAGSMPAPTLTVVTDNSPLPHEDPAETITSTTNAESRDTEQNQVSLLVRQILGFLTESNEIRNELNARGVPPRTTRSMILLGMQDRQDDLKREFQATIAMSDKAHGKGALELVQLEEQVHQMIELERELEDAKNTARQRDLDPQLISMLTQIMQKSPGDNGEKTINTFLGYAIACGIPLNLASQIGNEIKSKSDSVLPKIAEELIDDKKKAKLQLLTDIAVGVMIGLIIMWLVV
ncbi:MAG: hypothetical protein V3U76_20370 [Granulosicoccus sp.]